MAKHLKLIVDWENRAQTAKYNWEALKAACGGNAKQLARQSFELFNETGLQWLRKARLGRSKELLIEGKMCAKEVAHEVGFAHVQNFNLFFKKATGLIDPTFGTENWLKASVINEETSGDFLVPKDRLTQSFVRLSRDETELIVGRGYPNMMQDGNDISPDSDGPGRDGPGHSGREGRQGRQRERRDRDRDREEDEEEDRDECVPAGSEASCDICGMPRWRVSEPYVSLWLDDEPLGYQPSKGPRMSFQLNYKQRDTLNNSWSFNTGANWECSWLSFVQFTENNVNAGASVFTGGGGERFYGADGISHGWSSTLRRINDSNGVSSVFVQVLPMGSTNFFRFKGTNVFNGVTMHLSEQVDAFGNTNRFVYEMTNSVVLLRYVVDPDGLTNSVRYDTNDWKKISEVEDPYGRKARIYYDTNGFVLASVDVNSISNWFTYSSSSQGTLSTLHTPYGDTTFSATTVGVYSSPPAASPTNYPRRSLEITQPNGSKMLYVYRDYTSNMVSQYSLSLTPSNALTSPDGLPNDGSHMEGRNSFFWDAKRYPLLSDGAKTNLDLITSNDIKLAHLKHWYHDSLSPPRVTVGDTLSVERWPSADGETDGQMIWYNYYGKGGGDLSGSTHLPGVVAKILPDGTTNYVWMKRNEWGNPTNTVSTYSVGSQVLLRTNVHEYATNGIDLVREIFKDSSTNLVLRQYAYNSYHQVTSMTNAVGDVTSYSYDGTSHLLTAIRFPSGLTQTNVYASSGPSWLLSRADIEIARTNSFTYSNGLVATHTDPRGNAVTYTYDNLQRVTNSTDARGSLSFTYSNLDLVSIKDRLGNTTSFTFDNMRRKTKSVDALNRTNTFTYCDCGALASVTDPLGQTTSFYYDLQGRRTNSVFPTGGGSINVVYDALGRVVRQQAPSGIWTSNSYNNQGLLLTVNDSAGTVLQKTYDSRDRATNIVDANSVATVLAYDDVDRMILRTNSAGAEGFKYSTVGLIAYTNQLATNVTWLGYDQAGRKLSETNANSEVTRFTNSAAGDLLALVDGKMNVTRWSYDVYGRGTNKVDAANVTNFTYSYDANDRLTNRWTPAKGNAGYSYDAVGNLTNVDYAASTDVRMTHDALNRLLTMIDAAGNCSYSYAAFGPIATEDGPWASDTISYAYNNALRTSLTLAAPNGASYTHSYSYDTASRLQTLLASEGSYGYAYSGAGSRVAQLTLPNTSFITNRFDGTARLLSTILKNGSGSVLNSHSYGYDASSRRTAVTNFAGNYLQYGYDGIGQLKSAFGYESNGIARVHEKHSYLYDAGHNLNYRTNNDLVQTFSVDSVNQLSTLLRNTNMTVVGSTTSPATNVTVNSVATIRYTNDNTFARTNVGLVDGTNSFTAVASDSYGRTDSNTSTAYSTVSSTFIYDSNGNLVYDGNRAFIYDDENQLTSVRVTNAWKSDFTYDGKGRRRIRKEYIWNGSAWVWTNEVRYVYSGMLVLQERDANNLPTVTYTRGLDFSGTLEGAGGIGGLLARTDNASGQVAYYHADGNGNITMLINAQQLPVAKYLYDTFGNLVALSGSLGDANTSRFSSKEQGLSSSLYFFGLRYYDPAVQRWINRDPSGEKGGLNLYVYLRENPANRIDALGLADVDVYVWNWKGIGFGQNGSVGHVMMTAAGSQDVILSQFPHAPGGPSTSQGPNWQFSFDETMAAEKRRPSEVFRVHVPDDDEFWPAVWDHQDRPLWDAYPNNDYETHCARAVYDSLKRGGVRLEGFDRGQILPGDLGDLLRNGQRVSDFNSVIIRNRPSLFMPR